MRCAIPQHDAINGVDMNLEHFQWPPPLHTRYCGRFRCVHSVRADCARIVVSSNESMTFRDPQIFRPCSDWTDLIGTSNEETPAAIDRPNYPNSCPSAAHIAVDLICSRVSLLAKGSQISKVVVSSSAVLVSIVVALVCTIRPLLNALSLLQRDRLGGEVPSGCQSSGLPYRSTLVLCNVVHRLHSAASAAFCIFQ